MPWIPHPMSLHRFVATGTNDIGDASDINQGRGRFGLSTRFVLVCIKLKLGSGGNLTTFQVRRWHPQNGLYQFEELDLDDVTGGDPTSIIRVAAEDYPVYTFNTNHNGEHIVVEGSNSGNVRWELEVTLADAESHFNRTFTT